MIVVSNASPLIMLSKVGALHVLPALFEKVLVAEEVFHEITVTGVGRPGATAVQGASWIEVKSYTNAAEFARWRTQRGLGAGETATILLAQELSANLAIIDERTARGFATSLGVNVSLYAHHLTATGFSGNSRPRRLKIAESRRGGSASPGSPTNLRSVELRLGRPIWNVNRTSEPDLFAKQWAP